VAVRALVFDIFGTLVDWRSGVADSFRANGVWGDPYELADAWRARYRPILAEVSRLNGAVWAVAHTALAGAAMLRAWSPAFCSPVPATP
jgi:FMN phosphatase YigB (HAD superfamily)